MTCKAHKFRSVLAASSTSTSFTAQIPTATEPTGTGVIDLLDRDTGVGTGIDIPSWLQLIPYGTDGNDDTFDMRVWGYVPTTAAVYVPQLLLDVSVILGNIAGTAIGTGVFMPDTFTLNDAAADLDGAFEHSPWVSLNSPAEDLIGNILLHTRGCRYLKFDFDLAGGQEAVSMNCLWRPFDKSE